MAPKKMGGRPPNPAIEERRAKVLAAYRDGKTSPSAIAEALKLPRKTVENDLVVLRAAGKLAKGERPVDAPKPTRVGSKKLKPKAAKPKGAWPRPGSGDVKHIEFEDALSPDLVGSRISAPHTPIAKEKRAMMIDALREELTRLDADARAVAATIKVLQRGE